jgi:hypothetical protein
MLTRNYAPTRADCWCVDGKNASRGIRGPQLTGAQKLKKFPIRIFGVTSIVAQNDFLGSELRLLSQTPALARLQAKKYARGRTNARVRLSYSTIPT